jgi:hypothetical protein
MRKLGQRAIVVALCVASGANADGQHSVGSSSEFSSSKLALLVPNLYGSNGLVLPNPDHDAHFTSAFQTNFGPFNTALASRLTSLPIPSPASGFTYTFDPSIGVYTRSTSTFGPLLAERAETIGKNKFFAGFNYQHFSFQSLDGVKLNNVPSVFEHLQTTPDPVIRRDVITTENLVDVKISQYTSFFTYGLSDRIDLSVAVPFLRANMFVSSKATIRRIGTATDDTIHYFLDSSGNRTDSATFRAFGQASGMGDVLVRVKANAFDGKKAKLAMGLEARMPTGDPYEFLGSGAFGIKPFVALSIQGNRFSPHFNLGYQYNGRSVLAGDVSTGAERLLPRQLNYAAGFEAAVNKKLSFAADLMGQEVFSADRLSSRTFTAANGQRYPQVAFVRGNFHTYGVASGVKINPVSTLLVSFNLLYQVNDGGLRARVVPLLGLSYTF